MGTRFIAVLLLAGLPCSACSGASQWERPNVLLLIVDDLGWMDTGVYGSEFYETPNIDRLAASSALFTQFYAASPVCSPTRASIVAGKHPARLHLTNWIGGEQTGRLLPAEYRRELPLEEITIGEAFKMAGYATGYIGKWHLGDARHYPEFQGFDVNIAGHAAGQPGSYFYPYENDRLPWSNVPGLERGEEGEYLTDRLTDEALGFIDYHRDRPFFLVLSHYAVHTPLQAKAAHISKYQEKARRVNTDSAEFISEGTVATTRTRQDHPTYAGMVESTDESIGRIMERLEALEIAARTIVVLLSDNGGLSTLSGQRTTAPTANLPLRAGKGWLFEGGIRVPLVIRWPGVVDTAVIVEQPTMSTDIYPTLLEVAGIPLMPEQHLDGVSLVPLLRGSGTIDRSELYWHFPHYHGSGNRPSGAVRSGDFKLLEWLEDGRIELYNLTADPGETDDLSSEMSGKAIELLTLLHSWRESIDANMPKANPTWKDPQGGQS